MVTLLVSVPATLIYSPLLGLDARQSTGARFLLDEISDNQVALIRIFPDWVTDSMTRISWRASHV
jgi:hypothetical protein